MHSLQRCIVRPVVLIAVLLACSCGYAATLNVHWTPNLNGGGVSHGTTVSGNIWINFI